MTTPPVLISVIVPTFNRPDLLRRAVQSVLAQTYGGIECVVADNGSGGETRAVVAALGRNDGRVRYVEAHERPGASAARNIGVAASSGPVLAFLDDDDEWRPRKLELQMARLQACDPETGLVYCGLQMVDREGRAVETRVPRLSGRVFQHLIASQPLGNSSTLLVPRAVFDAVGGFDEALPRGNDGDFIRRIALRYAVEFVPDMLVTVHVDHGMPRITDGSADGIRKALAGHLVKLTKFSAEIDRFPKQKAALLANIGYHHALLGEGRACRARFIEAARAHPVSLVLHKRIAQALVAAVSPSSRRA